MPSMLLLAAVTAFAVQSAPGEIIGLKIPIPGDQVAGTTSKLSEVEAELVARMAPQGQAERLLQYAIARHVGATDEIRARLPDWKGRITITPALDALLDAARNGDDLRVRAASLEIELAAMNISKTAAQVDALIEIIRANPIGARPSIYALGALANRGVAPTRIYEELRALALSPDEMVRYQAYDAIAKIGTDDTVADLVYAFHFDPSRRVRIDGGGCGVAHCGMLTRSQRMMAVPGLIAMADDAAVSAADRMFAFRALREITDETWTDDVTLWRDWYAAHGTETLERFRRFDAAQPPF